MMNTIVTVVKYTALVLVVLVLSHIIQIRGTTISRHVEKGLNWFTGGHHASITSITQHFSSAIPTNSKNNEKDDDGITIEDKKELAKIIRKSK